MIVCLFVCSVSSDSEFYRVRGIDVMDHVLELGLVLVITGAVALVVVCK